MLKKLICATLSATILTLALASCGTTQTDETSAQSAAATDAATDAVTEAVVEDEETADVTAVQVLQAVTAAIENLPAGKTYDSANSPIDALTFHTIFMEDKDITFNEEGTDIIYPPIMDKITDYAIFIANGKSPIAVDVFKLADSADRDSIKQMCQDHINQIDGLMEGYDYEGVLAAVKANNGQTVYAKGNYVVMLSVLDPAAATTAIDNILKK